MTPEQNPQLRFEFRFDEFVLLRDSLREAKRDKSPERVIEYGVKLAALDAIVGGNIIAMSVFLKDMGKAYKSLGNHQMALDCFIKAKERYLLSCQKAERYQEAGWRKAIAIIEKLIEKEKSNLHQ